jgi:hypothetical protein
MDTWTPEQLNAHVKANIELIKTRMPETYKSISVRAATVDAKAHQLVRRGLRGEANCFYAFEGGHVVGTPFDLGYCGGAVQHEVAYQMVNFGCAHVCMWGGVVTQPMATTATEQSTGAQHGAH